MSDSSPSPQNVVLILCDTLRRDHCSPYHGGRPLNQCGFPDQPDWVVPTPNIDRLARRGTVFDQAYLGSTPCMPARRDIYTGRYEFLERGWGPLEDDDLDLPRAVSGLKSNRSLQVTRDEGLPVSYLATDHFHLWEAGGANYHTGFTGFEFIRGMETDNWATDPIYADRDDFECPPLQRPTNPERHFRNRHVLNPEHREELTSPARTFDHASDWLRRNRGHRRSEGGNGFFLHIDCFPPHEPWDPPRELLEMFDPDGYLDDWFALPPYRPWSECMNERDLRNIQARYAANVVLVDRQLGRFLDTMDELGLWDDTVVIFCTDHGTYNGDRGRIGKMQTHQFASLSHIPFIISHPTLAQGERRDQLVQLVDVYPTVLSAMGLPIPGTARPIHGKDLMPVLADASTPTRSHAVYGMFGKSISMNDGRWVLHQPPRASNQPLNWYSHRRSLYLKYDVGEYDGRSRPVDHDPTYGSGPLWLSDRASDPPELVNLADAEPDRVAEMRASLSGLLDELGAPPEQAERLGLERVATRSTGVQADLEIQV